MSIPIRAARPEDLDRAADALAAAFEDYPWTRYVIPADAYLERLRELQRLYLGYAQQHGLVAVTPDQDGAIALLPPEPPAPEPAMIDRLHDLHGDRIERLSTIASPERAWRLETLGVQPDSQGRGLASALIESALNEVTLRGATRIALETSDARNVRLYERHGFLTTDRSESSDRPPVWQMIAIIGSPRAQA